MAGQSDRRGSHDEGVPVEDGRRAMTRRLAIVVLLVAAPMAVAAPALAHGDTRLASETFMLAPGSDLRFTGDVHYHRIVVDVNADAPVVVRLVDVTGDELLTTRPSTDIEINELIRCCDDAAWTPHVLIIENQGLTQAAGSVRASLVHDDLAVMVFRAESGTVESVFILGGIWIWVLRRIRQGKSTSMSGRRAFNTLMLVAAAAVAVSFYGSARYGANGAPALLAGLVDLPVFPFNPVISRASAVIGMLMIGWAIAGARWARAPRDMQLSMWVGLGSVIAGAVLVAAALIIAEYDQLWMPVGMATAAVVPVGVFALSEVRRRSQRERVAQVT